MFVNRTKTTFYRFIIAGCFTALAACGGGGGGKSKPVSSSVSSSSSSQVVVSSSSVSVSSSSVSVSTSSVNSSASSANVSDASSSANSVASSQGVSSVSSSQVPVVDTTPDNFTFNAITNAALSTVVTSGPITLSGFTRASITITGGEYAIDSNTFTAAAGTITSGQTVKIRVTTSAAFASPVQATLTVGDVSASFIVTTVAMDTTPDALTFNPVTDAAVNAELTSNTVTISGINTAAPVTITGGKYALDSGAFTAAAGTVANGQTLTIKATASANTSTTTTATLSIGGGVVGSFSIKTVADTTPDAFSFTATANAKVKAPLVSGAVNVAGIDGPSPISVTGGEYSINDGAFTAAAGTVLNGNSVKVRLTSAATTNTLKSAQLTIGGVSGTYSVTTAVDNAPPTAQFIFPVTYAFTSGANILVRGSAGDAINDVSSVKVNGVEATTTDNYANWQVTIPLVKGSNTLTVAATDAAGNTASGLATLQVERDIAMSKPGKFVYDVANNRALLLDDGRILAINTTTGDRSVFAQVNAVSAIGIAMDAAHGRLLVADYNGKSVIGVDLTTGLNTVLSNSTKPNAVNSLSQPTGIAVDIPGNRALVVDATLKSVIAVDLGTGARTVFSSNTVPNTTLAFSGPRFITVDAANSRAIVYDNGLKALIAVNLASGARTMLSDASSSSDFTYLNDLVIDSAHNRVLGTKSLSGFNSAIVAANLANGTRSILSSDSQPNDTNVFHEPLGIAVDANNNRALVTDLYMRTMMAVDLNTGARTIISTTSTPNPNNPLFNPRGMVMDAPHNRLLVGDETGAIFAIDLTSRARTLLSSANIPTANNLVGIPYDLALDVAHNRLLVADVGSEVVFAVDLITGARTPFAGIGVTNSTPVSGSSIVMDTANNRALIVDISLNAVVALNLTNGAYSVLSSNTGANTANPFSHPTSITLDTVNNRALVSDSQSIIAVNLATGARTILTSGAIGFFQPRDLLFDAARNRALSVSWNKGIDEINLATGVITPISNVTVGNNLSIDPSSIVLDAANNRIFMLDTELRTVFAVDMVTGERIIFSR